MWYSENAFKNEAWNKNRELREIFEKATEASFVMEMIHEEDKKTELERSGLDPEELEFMNWNERREALEDAGLDPEDYDF